MSNIYVVTTLHIRKPSAWLGSDVLKLSDCIVRSRAVGWFHSFWEAEDVVVNNRGDIYECGHYNHCVIEEMIPGIYQPVVQAKWFRWGSWFDRGEKKEKKEGYVVVPKPGGLKGASNFSIG